MRLSKTSESQLQGRFTLRGTLSRLLLTIGTALLYAITFTWIINTMGEVGTSLIVIPVVLAGWFFGPSAGLIASLAGVILHLVLSTQSADFPTTFVHSWPGYLMMVVAGYIAGLLRRNTDERSRVESELRSREQFLTKLNEIAAYILGTQRSEPIHEKLAEDLTELLGADTCFLDLRDAASGQVVTVSASAQHPNFLDQTGGNSLSNEVLKEGKVIAIDDVFLSAMENQPHPDQLLYRSLLGIPLIVGEHRIGAIILAFDQSRSFSADELRRADQAGNLVALALWDVQQDRELQQRLRESNALAEIGRALGKTERASPNDVLQMIVDSARELIPNTEKSVIHLFDHDEKALIPQAVSGYQEHGRPGKIKMGMGEGVAGKVIAERIVVSIADVETDPRFRQQDTPPQYRSLMVAPVQSGEECIGTISVQSGLPAAFSIDEEALLSALGAQAAIAIENARLLDNTKQGFKEVSALYHITRGLVSSLETGQLMKDVVDLLQQNFGYYHIAILVIDPDTEEMVVQYGSGSIGELLKGERLPAGTGIIGHAAITGTPFFTNDVNQVVFYYPHPYLPDTQSELAVPIKVNGRVLGVLDVQQCPPHRLSGRDQQLVGTVADQLAVALQKASLYSDLQASLAQEKSIRLQLVQSERLALVGRLLASVSHELNNPLQAIQNALFLLKEEDGISSQGRQDLQIVLSETERMAGLIERLRASYRPTQLDEFQPLQLNTIVEDVYALLATHLRHKQVAFEFHPDPDLPLVSGLPDQLRQVTLNLLMNGVEAITSGGRLTVSTETTEGSEVLLSVSDTGPGIDPVILPHVFDAFVTSKESGTGLGLTITYDIVHRHQGRIQAANNPTGGATIKIWLPIFHAEQI